MHIEKGTQLWNRAKKIIPGGTQLLSKRSEQLLPGQWPSYYERAKGVDIWDLDGNKFVDMSLMGVGACILGYADEDVDQAVKKVIDAGSMSTLNSPEEVELAELLLSIDQWADMVRFARTGGESMAIAVRIARAHTRKDKIAFCGYHGWHDWYLSANLADDQNLDGQLLPGLEPLGVPRGLKGTAIPFHYNKIDELVKIIESNEIGTIILEPVRQHKPENDFLARVKKIAEEINAVLIFDEISSGWRMKVGGAYELYQGQPDMVVYAKAMSNGFPMAAVVGKAEIMDAAQSTFISSTYWTDRVGPAAALATIEKLKNKNVPQQLCKMGIIISEGWRKLAKEHDLDLEIMTEGLQSIPTFEFNYGDKNPSLQTYFTQEMLELGYLASKHVYMAYPHSEALIEKYIEDLDGVFERIKKGIEKGNIKQLLKGPIVHSGFKRLT
jgi:glutamate-1-semialdehyde 2,1-aminomutase